MSEERIVTEDQIKKVEAEIRASQAAELSKLSEVKAKEIEDKIRKEMAEKAEKEAQLKRLAELEESNKRLKEESEARIKVATEAFEKRIQELEAVKKGVVNTANPFNQAPSSTSQSPELYKGVRVDEEAVKASEELSQDVFVKHHGLPEWFGKPDPQRRY